MGSLVGSEHRDRASKIIVGPTASFSTTRRLISLTNHTGRPSQTPKEANFACSFFYPSHNYEYPFIAAFKRVKMHPALRLRTRLSMRCNLGRLQRPLFYVSLSYGSRNHL